MVVVFNAIDNNYWVREDGVTVLEVMENHERGCLEVSHYGRKEVAVQTIFSPQFNLEVEIKKPEDKDFEVVIIRTGYDTVSWEHLE